MFSKLSFRNVKRSFRDYAIYFLTLAFGVCIFYMFNSLESQTLVLSLSEMQSDLIKGLSKIMGIVSVFVAFVIGFLIIYANKFLIRKRKKEIGLYITLGMGRRKISLLLLIETLIIGMFALTLGLILGVFLSQGLSGVTAKLFSVDLTEFKFVFSSEALIKTIIYFGIMFLIVMIFNAFVVSRYKLIDLLHGDKKNESLKIKGKYQVILSVVLFIISVICIAVAYYLILKNGLMNIDNMFYTSILLGIIGTFLFFLSLSGFLLKVLQSSKRIYLKNLNMFVLRQINSKVNTAFISMSIICLMLFFTIGILSTGLSINNVMKQQTDLMAPYDASLYTPDINEKEPSVTKILEKYNFNPKKYAKDYVEFYEYETDFDLKSIINSSKDASIKNNTYLRESAVAVAVKLSDYNKLQKLKGKSEISLKDNETLLISSFPTLYDTLNNYIVGNHLSFNGKTYSSLNDKVVEESLETNVGSSSILTFVIKDNDANSLKKVKSTINLSYKNPKKDEKEFVNELNTLTKKFSESQRDNLGEEKLPYISVMTKTLTAESTGGMKVLFLYIGLYIGLVFLISSAAILAIQQLSEATDNIKRYEILKKIGVASSMANKSIFTQTFIYFMMPLSLAIIHSIVGIKVAKNFVSAFGDYNILLTSLITAFIICLIYGGYFIATYFGYKNIVKGK